jgi:hypothetical protein
VETLVLQGAIVALFGIVTAVAKVAWAERGTRVQALEKRVAYYEEQVMPTMNRVLDASDKQQTSLAVLTRVVEGGLKRTEPSG